MHRTRSKRSQAIRSAIVYTVMTMLVLFGLSVGVFYLLGYRLDINNRTIEQGGLVQFASKPSGARVLVDGIQVSSGTPARYTAKAGSRIVQFSRDGYRLWQKNISVDPGRIHWLNYARLFPEELNFTTMRSYTRLAAALPAVDNDRLLVLTDATLPQFEIVSLNDTASALPISLPVTQLAEPQADSTYSLLEWDASDRYVLVERRYNNKTEWHVLDTRSPENSVNVSRIIGSTLTFGHLSFDKRDSRALYGTAGDELRRISLNNRTVSAPIESNIESFSQSNTGVVSYVTKFDAATKTRTVGYYTAGASRTQIIAEPKGARGDSLHVAIGEYLGDQYIVLQHKLTLTVYRVSLHPSDSTRELAMHQVAAMNLAEAPDHVSFSPHDRFVVAQNGPTFVTYDIEHNEFSTTTLRGSSVVTARLGWLDDYYVWSDRDDTLRLYEFDGENSQTLSRVASGFSPSITKDNRYLYFVAHGGQGGYELRRLALTTN